MHETWKKLLDQDPQVILALHRRADAAGDEDVARHLLKLARLLEDIEACGPLPEEYWI